MMEISKELFEAVMNIKLGTYYSDNIETERRLWIDKDLICWDAVPFVDEISINDFFFKCKEWALSKGILLRSSIDGVVDFYDFIIVGEDRGEFIDCREFKCSEVEAIIKACEWILDNKPL